jgi:hypothetical protein
MLVIYICGPFTADTAWEIECNIRRAEELGLEVAKLGMMPLIPHSNTRYFHGQCTDEFWYQGTMELLRRCDALITVPGWENSAGSVAEVKWAKKNTWAFHDIRELSEWDKWTGI